MSWTAAAGTEIPESAPRRASRAHVHMAELTPWRTKFDCGSRSCTLSSPTFSSRTIRPRTTRRGSRRHSPRRKPTAQKGHGASRVPSYAGQARSGKVDGHAVPEAIRLTQSAAIIDARDGFAYPAIDLAQRTLLDCLASLAGSRDGHPQLAPLRRHRPPHRATGPGRLRRHERRQRPSRHRPMGWPPRTVRHQSDRVRCPPGLAIRRSSSI